MDEISFSALALQSLAWKIVRFTIIALGCWGVTRILDHRHGVHFHRDVLPALKGDKDRVGLGVYYGLRFFAVFYLGGQIFG